MRIGFDVAQTCVEKAGCGYYADSLAKALVRTFPKHEFILYHHFGEWCNESTADGTTIKAKNVSSPLFKWSRDKALNFWAQPVVDPEPLGNPDVVVSNSFQMPRIPNAYSLFTVYDISFWTHPDFHTEANRLVCQKGVLEALQKADAFSFISEFSKFDFQRMFPGWLEKRQNRSVVTTLAPRGKRQDNLGNKLSTRDYWLFVGSLEPRKNVETLLDAYEIYFKKSNHPLPLKLAGGAGWKSENTNSRIDIMSETMPVEHLGYVSDSELEKLYAKAFGFIFPSWYEGFGLPVVEAMNQGTPVITTLESSLREIAENYAYTFDPTSPKELTQKMLTLEDNPEAWKKLQKLSIKRADCFTWEKTAQMVHSILP